MGHPGWRRFTRVRAGRASHLDAPRGSAAEYLNRVRHRTSATPSTPIPARSRVWDAAQSKPLPSVQGTKKCGRQMHIGRSRVVYQYEYHRNLPWNTHDTAPLPKVSRCFLRLLLPRLRRRSVFDKFARAWVAAPNFLRPATSLPMMEDSASQWTAKSQVSATSTSNSFWLCSAFADEGPSSLRSLAETTRVMTSCSRATCTTTSLQAKA